MSKVTFMFIVDDANPVDSKSCILTPSVEFTTIGVPSYEVAARVAAERVDEGCILIELCAGFDETGTKMVVDAVSGKAKVAVCRMAN